MNQKIDKIGRISAVISSLVLMALMLNLWILEAIADEQNANVPQALHEPTQKPRGRLWDRMYHVFAPELQAGESVPIAEAQFERSMFTMKGRPVAYVLHDELYLVNRYGKIMGTADSLQHVDVPLISGSRVLIDPEHQIITDQRTQRALSFVIEIETCNNLQALVSEIKIRDDDLIVYMNFGDVVPVIFGSGDLHKKINILESYYEQLGASDLTQQAAYLDLRVEDRVVVKKRV